MPQLGWHRQLWTWNNMVTRFIYNTSISRFRQFEGIEKVDSARSIRQHSDDDKQVTAKRVQSTSASTHQVWTYTHCRMIPPEQAGNPPNETCACFYSVTKKLGVRSGLHKSFSCRPPATKDHNRTCWIIKLLAGNFLCLVCFLVIL